MSCEHISRLDWCQSGVPYFTRTTGGSRQVKRAITGAEVAGCACGGTSITNGMKRDVEEAEKKAMTAVLSDLLP